MYRMYCGRGGQDGADDDEGMVRTLGRILIASSCRERWGGLLAVYRSVLTGEEQGTLNVRPAGTPPNLNLRLLRGRASLHARRPLKRSSAVLHFLPSPLPAPLANVFPQLRFTLPINLPPIPPPHPAPPPPLAHASGATSPKRSGPSVHNRLQPPARPRTLKAFPKLRLASLLWP